MLYNWDHFLLPFRILLFLNIYGEGGSLTPGSCDKKKPTGTTSAVSKPTSTTKPSQITTQTTKSSAPLESTVTTATTLSLLIPPADNSESSQSDVSPSENDPRVGWVYHLLKPDLQLQLENRNLDPEGNMKDLRKRLVTFLRALPPTEDNASGPAPCPVSDLRYPVSTITTIASQPYYDTTKVTYSTLGPYSAPSQNSYERDSVREMLGLPPTATFRMVQEKLAKLRKPTKDTSFETHFRPYPATLESNYGKLEDYHIRDRHLANPTHSTTAVDRHPQRPPFEYSSQSETDNLRQASLGVGNLHSHRSTTPFDSPLNDVARVCNQVRKWNLRFDGTRDPVSFVERLNELAESYNVLPELLLKALPELLTGDALFWYRNNKQFWATFDDFLNSFEDQFLPPDYRSNLEEEITRRTQGETEPVRKFVVALTTLIRRSGGFSNHQLLNRLYSNLRPEYKLTIRRDGFQSVSELIRLAEGYESYVREKKMYRPPPNPSQSLVPETAYDSKNKMFKSYPVQSVQGHNDARSPKNPNSNNKNWYRQHDHHYNNVYYRDDPQSSIKTTPRTGSRDPPPDTTTGVGISHPHPTIPSIQPPVNQRVDARYSSRSDYRKPVPTIVCWNCDKIGHRFGDCDLPKVIRCFNCKTEGVLTTKCPCRSENTFRDRKPRGVPSLEFKNSPRMTGPNGSNL